MICYKHQWEVKEKIEIAPAVDPSRLRNISGADPVSLAYLTQLMKTEFLVTYSCYKCGKEKVERL